MQQIAASTEDLSRLKEELRRIIEEFHLTPADRGVAAGEPSPQTRSAGGTVDGSGRPVRGPSERNRTRV